MSAPGGGGPQEALGASPMAGAPGLRWRPGVPTVASPMRQAADATNWIVEADGWEPVFLKIYEADTLAVIDLDAAWAGAVAAGAAGVGPQALFACLPRQAIATAHLGPSWRAAFLGDLVTPEVLEGAIAAKRRFHAAPPLARTWDVFARTEALYDRLRAAPGPRPGDLDALVATSRAIASAVRAAGHDSAPCHNDGSASSLMIGPEHAVSLVDFDCAGQADPFYDLALLLNEVACVTADWSPGLERYAGRAEPRLLHRCRAYAVADDVMWGLWGHLLSATSPRRTVEFLKYGEWRLLRARMAAARPDFAASLHGL